MIFLQLPINIFVNDNKVVEEKSCGELSTYTTYYILHTSVITLYHV